MKNKILIIVTLITATAASVGLLSWLGLEKGRIVVVNGGTSTSPTSVFAKSYVSAYQEGDFQLGKNCDDTQKVAQKYSNSVRLLTNDHIASAIRRGEACDTNINPNRIVLVADNHFQVCRLPETSIKLTDAGVTLGRASVHPVEAFNADFNASNPGVDLKTIPFKGSKNVLQAVLNGDINWGIIASSIATPMIEQDKIVCEYDTTPKGSATGKSLNDHFNLNLDGFMLKYMLVAENTKTVTIDELKKAANSAEFQMYLVKGGFYNISTNVTASHVADIVKSGIEKANYGK